MAGLTKEQIAAKKAAQAPTPVFAGQWDVRVNPKPTVKLVHIHATSEILGMKSTVDNKNCNIHEFIDGTDRLLLISKKHNRHIVLSGGNYKMYELL